MTDQSKQLVERLYEEAQDNVDSLYFKAAAELERLSAENEELRRDAERLTWLSSQNENLVDDTWVVLGHDCNADQDFKRYWVGSDLRGAIDSAIAAQGEVKP